MAFSVAEDELRGMDTGAPGRPPAAWNYYQSVDAPRIRKFVNAFKEYAQKKNLPGGAKRVTDDRWRPATSARTSGSRPSRRRRASTWTPCARPSTVRSSWPGRQDQDAREQPPRLQARLIGEILKDGQFKIVSRTKGLVEPEPWSKYTSADKGCDWVGHQGTYQKKA